MIWQLDLHQEIVSRLPAATEVGVAGSAATPELLDGWSDLDLHLALPADLRLTDVVGSQPVWAFENVAAPGSQVLRVVLADGRRLDLVVRGPGRVIPPPPPDGNDIRFVACAAAVKLGRGDRLIGLHLVLDLLRRCLVQAMLLRDHHSGTNAHRFGTDQDRLADQVRALADLPLTLTPRPNVVEQAVALHDRWRRELHPADRSDWSGLAAVLDRGLAP